MLLTSLFNRKPNGKSFPRELEEEILYCVSPLSLTRFKTVCKQWNTLLKDKTFINQSVVGSHRPSIPLMDQFQDLFNRDHSQR